MGDGQAGDLDGEIRVLKSEMKRVSTETIRTISPAQLTANTDNWNPTNLSDASVIRVSTDASRDLTGITAPSPAAPRWIILINVGSFNLVLRHDATSTAANRFYCPDNADYTLAQGCAVLLWYDSTSTRWRVTQEIVRRVPQDLQITGDISPAQIIANTDNYNPTGLSTATVLRLSTDASRNLTGLAGGADGRVIVLMNVGAQDLVLIHDATSTAENRFYCPNNANLTLRQNTFAILVYDSTSLRWRVISPLITHAHTAASSGGALAGTAAVLESGTYTADLGPSGLNTRTHTTTYQNTSGKKRRVSAIFIGDVAAAAGMQALIDTFSPPTTVKGYNLNRTLAMAGTSHFLTLWFEVENNSYYQVARIIGSETVYRWYEMDE